MTWRRLFYSDAGVLRTPWRIFIFLLASFIGMNLAGVFAGPVIAWLFARVGLRGVTDEWWVAAIGVIAGTVFALRYIDKRPWSDVWLDRTAARPSALALGFAIGAGAIGLPIVVLIGVHWLREDPGGAGSWSGAAFRIAFTLLPAALFEELVTRGYILSVLREWLDWRWAIVVTSVGFGLLHLANNGVTAESVLLVTLAGFFLAAVLYATRSLYAAWMAHFAWNWTMAAIFHSAVSGYPMEAPRYRYVDAGPDWATGGDWGPEGGVPAGLGMGGGAAYLFVRRRRARHPDASPSNSPPLARGDDTPARLPLRRRQ